MVDYYPVSQNRKSPESAPEPEKGDEELPESIVAVVWNVYEEKGNAKSLALRISIRLPR
jgi:hypothetical protein